MMQGFREFMFMLKRVVNPCIGYCLLNEDDMCEGCGRTKMEKLDWIMMSDTDKEEVVALSQQRLIHFKNIKN